jgi:hypothetical protein
MALHRRGMGGDGIDSDDLTGDDVELLRTGGHHPRVATTVRSAGNARRSCLIVTAVLFAVGLLAHGLLREWTDASQLQLVTWNIAAINNNPFEYWITHKDEDYNKLMVDVQEFISSPGERDVPVKQVFTPAMWADLKQLMAARGWAGLDEVESLCAAHRPHRHRPHRHRSHRHRPHRHRPAIARTAYAHAGLYCATAVPALCRRRRPFFFALAHTHARMGEAR